MGGMEKRINLSNLVTSVLQLKFELHQSGSRGLQLQPWVHCLLKREAQMSALNQRVAVANLRTRLWASWEQFSMESR